MSAEVTALLQRWRAGDGDALDRLLPLVYHELHGLARGYLRREHEAHTLQPTALINEAVLRLLDQRAVDWQNRQQFVAICAQAMRRVLVDHARRRLADKRPDPRLRVELDAADGVVLRDEQLLALDEALSELGRLDPRQAQIVELKYFAGLDTDEICAVLGISPATVGRDWRLARGWLWQALA